MKTSTCGIIMPISSAENCCAEHWMTVREEVRILRNKSADAKKIIFHPIIPYKPVTSREITKRLLKDLSPIILKQ